jgi:hypothetical protein
LSDWFVKDQEAKIQEEAESKKAKKKQNLLKKTQSIYLLVRKLNIANKPDLKGAFKK